MRENYIFNEEYKWFESTNDECAYCHKEKMTDKMNCFYLPIYSETDRTYLVVYSSVKYAKVFIRITRCDSCHDIHIRAKDNAQLIGFLTPVILIVLCTIIFKGPGFFLSLITCPFIGLGLYEIFVTKFITDKGIKPEKAIAEENELVQDFLNAGWTLKQPQA